MPRPPAHACALSGMVDGRSVMSDWLGWVLGRRRADSPCALSTCGLTGFGSVARRRPRIAGVT